MTMMLLMVIPFDEVLRSRAATCAAAWWGVGGWLRDAAVSEDDLAVDPAGGPGEERDGLGDVAGLGEALQRGGLGRVRDGGIVLGVEEEGGVGRAGGDRVDG